MTQEKGNIDKLIDNLMLTISNITTDNPDAAEVEAINAQAKHLVPLSNQVLKAYSIKLGAMKVASDMGLDVVIDSNLVDIKPLGKKKRLSNDS